MLIKSLNYLDGFTVIHKLNKIAIFPCNNLKLDYCNKNDFQSSIIVGVAGS